MKCALIQTYTRMAAIKSSAREHSHAHKQKERNRKIKQGPEGEKTGQEISKGF